MGWMHTWLGVALSAVLFAVFWTGTLTVFDKEIDQWMKPELRIPSVHRDAVALDLIALPRMSELDLQPGSVFWVGPPRERLPYVRLYYEHAGGGTREEWLDPRSGATLEPTDSHAGSEFFFRFHFMLLLPGVAGYYIVGIAALGMMALVVSGVFVHRKIIRDFFTFRPQKSTRRAILDLHNLAGVVALPFHFMIPFTGLLILTAAYFPWSMAVPYGGELDELEADLLAYERPMREPTGLPGDGIDSLDRYVSRANDIWRAQEGADTSTPDWVAVVNPNDANAYVVVERYFADRRIALGPDQIVIDPSSGQVIDQFAPLPIHRTSAWLEGLHWIQFDHWPLRWLYFIGGLLGCAMIGSGFLYWVEGRISRTHPGGFSSRILRAVSVASTAGIIFASCCFLIANRILPKHVALDQLPRHDLEVWAFFLVWLLTLVHALVRTRTAWSEQSIAIAAAATSAVVLNWITTGDHPIAAFNQSIKAVGVMDAVMLAGAACATWTAVRLRLPRTSHPTASATRVMRQESWK